MVANGLSLFYSHWTHKPKYPGVKRGTEQWFQTQQQIYSRMSENKESTCCRGPVKVPSCTWLNCFGSFRELMLKVDESWGELCFSHNFSILALFQKIMLPWQFLLCVCASTLHLNHFKTSKRPDHLKSGDIFPHDSILFFIWEDLWVSKCQKVHWNELISCFYSCYRLFWGEYSLR